MQFSKRRREAPQIVLTSFVDILFNLIIFFTISTTFANSGGIDVSLPESSSRQTLKKAEKVYVAVARDGKAYIGGERLADENLKERLRQALDKDKETLVVIQADQLTSHGRVVAVMDLAKEVGLDRIAIAVDQKPGPDTLEPPAPPTPAPEKTETPP